MKHLLSIGLLLLPSLAHSAVYQIDTNFGTATEFDRPTLLNNYPNTILSRDVADRIGGNPYGYSSDPSGIPSGNIRYFGFKFALTDTFTWNDGGYIDEYDNALNGDFEIGVYSSGEKIASYLIEDTGERWLFGSFYNEIPLDIPITRLTFSLDSLLEDPAEYGGTFIFDANRTSFYVGTQPTYIVPETSSIALFILGALSLVMRRRTNYSNLNPKGTF